LKDKTKMMIHLMKKEKTRTMRKKEEKEKLSVVRSDQSFLLLRSCG
jgi:hypothetical protein